MLNAYLQVKGIAAHFHRSNKGYNKLKQLQRQLRLPCTKPPVACATRWAGLVPILRWVAQQQSALVKYSNEAPDGCAANDDKTTYKDHALNEDEYKVVHQLVFHIYHMFDSLNV